MDKDKLALAAYIRDGLRHAKKRKIQQIRMRYIVPSEDGEKICAACAIGMALIGKYKDENKTIRAWEKRPRDKWHSQYAADILGVPYEVVSSVIHRFTTGMSIESVLEWLEKP